VTIAGQNTKLEHLAKVANITKGMTDIVDPLKLGSNFNFILQVFLAECIFISLITC